MTGTRDTESSTATPAELFRWRIEVDEWKDYADALLKITTHYVVIDATSIEEAERQVTEKLEMANEGRTRSRFQIRSYIDMGPVPTEVKDT